MTRLTGEFQTDLQMTDALAACAEAVHGLGWRIETVEGSRIVSYPNGNNGSPRIELGLGQAGDGTSIRITGSDTDDAPLQEEALISDLDRIRDAVEESVDEASADAKTAPEGGNGAGPAAVAEQKTEERPAAAEEAERAAATAAATATAEKAAEDAQESKPEAEGTQAEEAEESATEQAEEPKEAAEQPEGAAEAEQAEQAELPPAGWYPNPEGNDERFWDGEQWTERYRSSQPEAGEQEPVAEQEPEPAEAQPEAEPAEQPRVAVAAAKADNADRSVSKDLLWGMALAFGAVAGSAAAFSVPDTAFYMPLCFGIAGLALAIAAFTVPGKNAWWAVVAVIASIGGIAVGVHKYSNYNDTKDKISQAEQQLQNLRPPK